jgi:hypothetical protein
LAYANGIDNWERLGARTYRCAIYLVTEYTAFGISKTAMNRIEVPPAFGS